MRTEINLEESVTFDLNEDDLQAMGSHAPTPEIRGTVEDGKLLDDAMSAFPPYNCAFCAPLKD